MKQRHFTALISGMILVSALSLTGCAEKQQPSPQPEVTEAQAASIGLYSFSAETLDGSVFTQEDLSGRDLTVINFWSVTCGPCIAEMPDLAEFADRLPSNIQVLTVCLDGSRSPEEAQAILDESGFHGNTLIAGDGDFLKVCGEILYTPTTIFADQDGNLVGSTIIGGQKDLAQAYTDAVNNALKSMGKAEIVLEEKQ